MEQKIPQELLDAPNMVAGLAVSAKLYGDHVCQIFKDDSKQPGEYKHKRTLREYYDMARDLACGLIVEGAQPGYHISILSENRPEWNLLDHAILMARCTTVGIYTNDSIDIIQYKFEDTQSWAIVVEDKKQYDKIASIKSAEVPFLKKIILLDKEGVDLSDQRIVLYDDLLKKGREAGENVRKELDERIASIKPGDIIRLVYTSGTSGRPKGVMLTHNNLKKNVESGAQSVEIVHDDILISYMPESHSFQTFLSQCMLASGGCIAYSFRKTLISDLPQVRPTLFAGVQRVWAKIQSGLEAKISSGLPKILSMIAPGFLAKSIKNKVGIDNVRLFVSGAGRLEPYTFDFFQKVLGVTIYLGYGLSETAPVISVNQVQDHRFGSSGKPIKDVDVKIVDEDRNEVPIGTTGEITARGPNVFVGYHNNMDKYDAVIDKDGWFYTGDRGYMDKDGFLYVLGRAGHRVKFADGEHHDLEEIGARILGYTKYIAQIAVYGEYMDFPVAIISLSDDEDDLKQISADLGVPFTSVNEFAYNAKVVEAVRKDFEQACQKLRDNKEVTPIEDTRKALYIRPMSEANNEKTPTQKTRLAAILQKYEPQIKDLYKSNETFMVHKPGD